MDIYSMTGEFEYPTSSQPVVGYLIPMGKNPGYWSVFSWIQSYVCNYELNLLIPRITLVLYSCVRVPGTWYTLLPVPHDVVVLHTFR